MSDIIEEESIISDEIREDLEVSGSGIADEIATMSVAATSAAVSRSKPQGSAKGYKIREDAVLSKSKFTNSIIDEESNLGFSITGGGKRPIFGGKKDAAIESSIMDEIEVTGFGGSRSL